MYFRFCLATHFIPSHVLPSIQLDYLHDFLRAPDLHGFPDFPDFLDSPGSLDFFDSPGSLDSLSCLHFPVRYEQRVFVQTLHFRHYL
jgi:hypothetical protein